MLKVKEGVASLPLGKCIRCSHVSSQPVCKACTLLEGLNKGLPKLAIGKATKMKKALLANGNMNS